MQAMKSGSLLALIISAPLIGSIAALSAKAPTPEVIRYVDAKGQLIPCDRVDRLIPSSSAKQRECAPAINPPKKTTEPRQVHYSSPTYVPLSTPSTFPVRGSNPDRVRVRGYTTKSGRYVKPHYRSRANSTRRDNWSTRGNRNPTNGRIGRRRARR